MNQFSHNKKIEATRINLVGFSRAGCPCASFRSLCNWHFTPIGTIFWSALICTLIAFTIKRSVAAPAMEIVPINDTFFQCRKIFLVSFPTAKVSHNQPFERIIKTTNTNVLFSPFAIKFNSRIIHSTISISTCFIFASFNFIHNHSS